VATDDHYQLVSQHGRLNAVLKPPSVTRASFTSFAIVPDLNDSTDNQGRARTKILSVSTRLILFTKARVYLANLGLDSKLHILRSDKGNELTIKATPNRTLRL
jgi:hypothetical protein